MDATELWNSLFKGEQHEPPCQVVGFRPSDAGVEMICDCGPDDEC